MGARSNLEGGRARNMVMSQLRFDRQINTLSAALTLVQESSSFQVLDPGGASRDVTLPALANGKGLTFVIKNTADAEEDLVVKNPAGATILVIPRENIGMIFGDGAAYYGFLTGPNAQGSRIVTATASTLTVTAALHSNRMIVLTRAAGIAVTLPTPTGSGLTYDFVLGTAVTSNSTTIKVPSGAETMVGNAIVFQDGGSGVIGFEAGATADTITFNGNDSGGFAGDRVKVTDISTTVFAVEVVVAATGTEATPFSATVS